MDPDMEREAISRHLVRTLVLVIIVLLTLDPAFADDANVLAPLAYDGTSASLKRIQEAVMPAAKGGNIIALNIVRQTMYGLGQDMALEALPRSLAKDVRSDVLKAWLDAVKHKADAGDTFFTVVLGILYYDGHGVEQDKEKAFQLWQRAAAAGSALAKQKLANSYARGDGVAKDVDRAMGFFQQAGDGGDAIALYNLGCMYFHGEGIPSDQAKGVACWKKSAPMGHAGSQYNLGLAYMHGLGVGRNKSEGWKWLEKAASQGHPQAKEYVERYDLRKY